MHYALLTSNHPGISRRYVDWYLRVLPAARRNAAEVYGRPGARFGWEQNGRGEECAVEPFRDQHHVNADIASQAYQQALWTNAPSLTERIKPLLAETGTFLASHLKWDKNLKAFVSSESTDLDEYAQEVRGAIATQVGAAWLAEACHELGVDNSATEHMRGHIYLPKIPAEQGPVLGAYLGDTLDRSMKHPSPLLVVWWLPLLDSKSSLVQRTFDATLRRIDLNNTPTFNRPWLALVAARMGDGDRAYALLKNLLEAPGAVVEEVCFAETQGTHWTHFVTTGGALVSAVNEMLLQSYQAPEIAIFPAVPQEWLRKGVSFRQLRARGNLVISARSSATEVTTTLTAGAKGRQVRLTLPAPGPENPNRQVLLEGRPVPFERIRAGRISLTLDLPAWTTRHIRVSASK